MKKILLATTLLSIAMSENILMKNYLRPKTAWIHDKQFWNKKIKRTPLNEFFSEVEDLSNYDRQVPQISNTQFISNSKKSPSLTFVRPSDLVLLPQVELLSSDKPKLDSAKPTVLISIDIQEGKNDDNLHKDCSKINKHHKHNHGWQIEQPFYVEEPRWINIYDTKSSPQRLYQDNSDPYILSRGKKIFRIKDTEQAEKMIENYENFSNKYPSRSKRSTKNRVERSIVVNEKYQNNTKISDNQKDLKKGINYYNFLHDTDSNNVKMTKSQDKKFYKINEMLEDRKNVEDITSSVYNAFIKKYQKDKIKNVTEKLPYEFKFIKENQTPTNDEKVISFVEQKQNTQHQDVSNHIKNVNGKIMEINQDKKFNNRKDILTTNTNKKNKSSVSLKSKNFFEIRNKYKSQEMDTSFDENVKRNETDVYEQMKNKTYINKPDDLNMYNDDTFTSSKKNPNNRAESSNKKDIDHNKSIGKSWKIQYFAHRKKLENAEELRNEKNKSIIDQNDIQAIDLRLTSKSDSRIENYFDHRKKRSACENCKIDLQNQWLKDMEKKIQDSLSLEQRNKHSDILEDLSLHEPYVISRGKKASHGFENNIYSTLKPRNLDDAGRIKATSFPLTQAFLRMLLMEMSRCRTCEINMNRLSNKRSPKDRRGLLDKILLTYDPYYVVRGKRINLDKYLKMQNQKDASKQMENNRP